MVLLLGGVFSKEPFYWLLQYLGNTQKNRNDSSQHAETPKGLQWSGHKGLQW